MMLVRDHFDSVKHDCYEGREFDNSFVVSSSEQGFEKLEKGVYTLFIFASWNEIALEDPDYTTVNVTVHAPGKIRIEPASLK
jgi:hypothetical protein